MCFADIGLNTHFHSAIQGPNTLNNVILYLMFTPFNTNMPFPNSGYNFDSSIHTDVVFPML